MKNYFCILRDIFRLKDFFNETTEYQLLGCFGSGRVFWLPSESTFRRSHTAVRQMATRNVGNVLLLRNQIKLALTAAAGFVGGPVFFRVCVSQMQMYVHWVAERLHRKKQHRISKYRKFCSLRRE